jgi:putative transposase
MQLRYNFRVYPTPGQQIALARAFGCVRVVYNDALTVRETARREGLPYVTDAELSKALTAAKKDPGRVWLGEVSSVVLQQALADLNTAYRNFFASVTGKRKGTRVGAPRYRSRRDNRQAIRFTKNARFQVTAVVEVGAELLPEADTEVGIDLGLSTFAVLSNGKTIASPRFLRQAERRLKKAQRVLSRKQKGSANRVKARVRVAKTHARVADMRRDWAHKQSTTIIRENQAVFVEDLCVKGLARTRLAKSVHDAGWGMFVRMLEDKAVRHGRAFSKVDRWFPSTRMCSVCGVVGDKKPLHVRTWTCTCGIVHDRDLNAAVNVLAAGRAERLNACGGAVSLPA